MFFPVLWGKTKSEKQIGVAADFCPVCRKISAFAIMRVGMAMHVYFIPAEEGKFLGHSQTCLSCGTSFISDPSRFARIVAEAGPSIDRLVQETFPSIREQFSEQLALGERIAADPHAFDAKTRRTILMQSFQIAASLFQNRNPDTGLRVLANALRPLDPSDAEVRDCLDEFRQARAAIGLHLRAERLMKTLRERPSLSDFDY